MDGQLWSDLHRLRWPIGVSVEKFLDAGKHKMGRAEDTIIIYC